MSKLQNNFTTIEQSKRLLELGVPADSSDCIYYGKGLSPSTLLGYNGNQFLYSEIKESEDYIPCWSVGRLIEIYGFGTNQHIGNIWYRNPMECIISDIEISIENGEMDFSKLRE